MQENRVPGKRSPGVYAATHCCPRLPLRRHSAKRLGAFSNFGSCAAAGEPTAETCLAQLCVCASINRSENRKKRSLERKETPSEPKWRCKPVSLNSGPLFSFYHTNNTANHIEVCSSERRLQKRGRKKIYIQIYKATEINLSGNSLREQNK